MSLVKEMVASDLEILKRMDRKGLKYSPLNGEQEGSRMG
jgi:hypothetical protein